MAEDEQMNDQFQTCSPIPKSKLVLILRIGGEDKTMCPTKRKLLYSLRLRKVNTGVFVKADETLLLNLRRLKPYVKYKCSPSFETVKGFICNLGAVKLGKRITRLKGNNNVVEEAFGQYNIFCIQDVVNEITNIGPHFKELSNTIRPFRLIVGEVNKKRHAADHITHLISKINIS